MKKSLQENHEYIRVLLGELSGGSCGRIELMRRFISKSSGGSPAVFDSIFAFLVFDGRVRKSGGDKRAPYCITERGRKFLEALS